jgi:hypothetical protein
VKLLAETLDSVAAQTFAEWEHIVVDDGSDDGTGEMVAARAEADPRLRYIVRDTTPSGANACRNIGIRAATASFVVMLDSDDVLSPDCLDRRVRAIRRNRDLDFATFQGGVFNEQPGDLGRVLNGEMIGDDLCRFLYVDEAPWQTSAPIWRRASLQRLGLFDESLLSWQDIELHVRAIASGCRYIREPQVDHHVRWQFEPMKVSVEQRRSPDHLEGALNVARLLENHVRTGPGLDWVRSRALCSLYFATAERWVERGEPRRGFEAWAAAGSRELCPPAVHLAGAALLALKAAGFPMTTVVRKWKGWTRLRTLPELVPL